MPEINNSLAMQVASSPVDLKGTLGALSQIQLANAHAGLYGLQSQQEQRKLNALQYLKENPTDYLGYIQQGGDPSVGSTLQSMGEKERQFSSNPLGLASENYKHVADTAKTVQDTRKIGSEFGSQIAQGVISDPQNDSVWRNAVDQHYQTFGGSTLEKQQVMGIKDPNQRLQIAKAYAAQGVSPNTFGAPHNVEPTQSVTTPAASYAVPQNAPARAPVQSSPRVMGDDEAVRNGLYEPTADQTQRGIAPQPNARVSQGFGQLGPAMTPAQVKESTEYADTLGKMPAQLSEKANNAKNMNFTLQQMRDESANWPFMGKGTEAAAEAAKYLKPFANAFGSTTFDNFVGDFEAFKKNAGTLVRQAVKDVSSRAAVQEFQMIQDQLPSADMSRGGFNKIVDQFQAVNDYQIAKQRAAQNWRDKNGTLDKFDADWNKNVSPTAFLIQRMSPEQLTDVATKLQATPSGRQTLNSMKSQMRWANENGLF